MVPNLPNGTPIAPEVLEIATLWDTLSVAVRAGIVAMVRAARKD